MSAVLGTIRDGQVKFDQTSPWPEGQRVYVDDKVVETVPGFLSEEEQGTDPESIARWIAWYNSLEPIEITDEEYERMEKEVKDFGKHSLVTDQKMDDLLP